MQSIPKPLGSWMAWLTVTAISLVAPALSPAAITLSESESDPFAAIAIPETSAKANAALEALNRGEATEAREIALELKENEDPVGSFLLGMIDEQLGQLENAEQHYREALRDGHKPSSLYLATLVLSHGGESRREEGRFLLKSAREEFPVDGEILHGNLILNGALGEPDFDKIKAAWESAASAGSTEALVLLGHLHNGEFGFTARTEPATAAEYFRRAARNDNLEAMLQLGHLLITNKAEETTQREGRTWLERAANKGEFRAMQLLAKLAIDQDKDHAEAFKWFLMGSEAGFGPSSTGVGMLYDDGLGVEENRPKALEFYLKASEQGDALGAFNAAMALREGYDGDPDQRAAYPHLLIAANGGMALAKWELAKMYFEGHLGPGDAVAATAWLDRAADAGLVEAQFQSGILALQGIGTPTNFQKAGIRLTEAANNGHPEASFHLARMYENGIGTDPDPVSAWVYYKLAEEFGFDQAPADAERIAATLSEEQRGKAEAELASSLEPFTESAPE